MIGLGCNGLRLLCLLILYSVGFLGLGSDFDLDFFLRKHLRDEAVEGWHIGFHHGFALLVLGDDAGVFLQAFTTLG